MSFPLRDLPVMQNWDCHTCGDCCHRMKAVITDEEKRRIEALDLVGDPDVAAKPWFARAGSGKWTLRHRPDGGCVFLTAANHCRLQERFGADVKPFVCRLFPFLLIPAGNHWRVGMRFSCPSAAANQGRPVADARNDLVHLSGLLEQHVGRSADSATPALMQMGEQLAWPEMVRVVEVLVDIVQDRGDRLERRLRKCLALARHCRRTRLDALQGNKLSKYVQAVRGALDADVPRDPSVLPPPDPVVGRLVFRILVAAYVRRVNAPRPGSAIASALGRVHAGWRFARGRGPVPRINEFVGEVRFEDVENANGFPPELDEILERYYVVKLSSLQFCGPPNFDLPFWAGLESLVLTLPLIAWLSRAIPGVSPVEAVQKAIQVVDDHFGGDPMVSLPYMRSLQRTLAERGELEKLVAWYAR